MTRESKFEREFLDRLEKVLPGCMVIKGNSAMRQGLPDRLILHEDHWAALEFKRSGDAHVQSNQDYYVGKLNDMSYAAFVSPENADEVLDEIQSAFRG